jgi:hypothetical protein
MSHKKRDDYLALRRRYEPENMRLAIVAESPPASGKYFYDQSGAPTEPLFAALMRQLGHSPLTKESGLQEFQRNGWVLADATYEPVNGLSAADRDRIILRDYPLLRDDLTGLLSDRATPLILIKANVCRLLEPRLREDRFNVINHDRAVYFPGSGQQAKFHEQFGAILRSAGI